MLATAGLATLSGLQDTKIAAAADASTEAAEKMITLPARSEVAVADTWDLTSLFPNDEQWKKTLDVTKNRFTEFAAFQGKLDSADNLLRCLELEDTLGNDMERILIYARLRASGDVADAKTQEMMGLASNFSTAARQAKSFIRPELLALDEARWAELLADPKLKLYELKLRRLLRQQPHTLSAAEEQLLASIGEVFQAPADAFGLLNDADLTFGAIQDENGRTVEISTGNFIQLLNSPDRNVRRAAFEKFFAGYKSHENTLGSLLGSSVKKTVIQAKLRKQPSALESALFNEEITRPVYDHLIAAVHEALPDLYRFYELRRTKMGLETIHMYDTYVPILADITTHYTWEQAVETIAKALAPLGENYVQIMTEGLTTKRWCDRYENKGKRSGAFSSGGFSTLPYIMMNYKSEVIDSMFTLAHEAGHSMHTYFSTASQPFVYYDNVIFVAEVASTFNEDLLARYLMKETDDRKMKAWLINSQIDMIRTTWFRQTMFAEFEQRIHAAAEAGEAVTAKVLQAIYFNVLKTYYGPKFTVDPILAVECLRIPHFYRPFYVYKYATGLSAALALAERVCAGGDKERDDYLQFLSGGCSDTPIGLLRKAGVDMETPNVVRNTAKRFAGLVDELERLL